MSGLLVSSIYYLQMHPGLFGHCCFCAAATLVGFIAFADDTGTQMQSPLPVGTQTHVGFDLQQGVLACTL